jgi:uncharacterized RDD family membrane protein YckC
MDCVKEPAAVRTAPKSRTRTKKSPSLLEFPGVNRSAMPEWRKELGERVREVQEKRAREATLEGTEMGFLSSESDTKSGPTLELLPQADLPTMNPIVVAALRRIERANSQSGNAAVATAALYEEEPAVEEAISPMAQVAVSVDQSPEAPVSRKERVHNLAVVPAPPLVISSELVIEPKKPRRVIDEQNPALNYLDSIPTSICLETGRYDSAPILRRITSAVLDLVTVGLLSSPFLVLADFTTPEWQNPRMLAFAGGTFLTVAFLYFTVSVAFTGRTLAMKLLSLRVVDARTGLIPTGSQAAGRSLVYILCLAAGGILLMYMFIDREKQTVHDRSTHTAVTRA